MKIDVDGVKARFDLLALVERDTTLKRTGNYHVGPCPFCGGDDRFTLKTLSGGCQVWLCRMCGSGKYADAVEYIMRRNNVNFMQAIAYMNGGEIGEIAQMNELEALHRERQARDKQLQRKEEIDERLSDLSTKEIWEALHRRLTDTHRQWWRGQGIPDEWQDYLYLGYTEDKAYYDGNNELQHSEAYTIPYFHYEESAKDHRILRTMQYRLFNPPNPKDRYRFENGVGTSFYMTTPTKPMRELAVICEGAKKAIVTRINCKDKQVSVLAVPSKMDWGGIVDKVKNCGRVWVTLDPDASKRSFVLAKEIGKNARVVELPMKIDDAFLCGALDARSFARLLTQGVKV